MAHGKSLELAAITRPEPQRLCTTCGKPWSSHQRKDGKGLLKKFWGHRVHGTYRKAGK